MRVVNVMVTAGLQVTVVKISLSYVRSWGDELNWCSAKLYIVHEAHKHTKIPGVHLGLAGPFANDI